jgi:TM2 domain-containing membrane protein YozV
MKSKVKAFFLSFIPGLGHIYLGENNRGLIFLGGFLSYIFTASFLNHSYDIIGGYSRVFEAAIPALWIFNVLDCVINAEKINKGMINLANDKSSEDERKLISFMLSVIPGLGQLYLGEREKGQKLLSLFLVVYILSSLVNIDILRLGIPAIIIYSILDLMNIKGIRETTEINFSGKWFDNWVKLLGVVFIAAGVIALANRFLGEFVDNRVVYMIKDYTKVILSSVILIGFGIKMLFMGRPREINRED